MVGHDTSIPKPWMNEEIDKAIRFCTDVLYPSYFFSSLRVAGVDRNKTDVSYIWSLLSRFLRKLFHVEDDDSWSDNEESIKKNICR
jgi:hypothetical protein